MVEVGECSNGVGTQEVVVAKIFVACRSRVKLYIQMTCQSTCLIHDCLIGDNQLYHRQTIEYGNGEEVPLKKKYQESHKKSITW